MQYPPLLIPSAYSWSESAPGQWQRRALAGEALWIPRAKEYHEMFIGGSLTFEDFIDAATVYIAAKSAWRKLRFEVPELVVTAGYDDLNTNAYMRYQSPSNADAIKEWVDRTISFNRGKQSLDFKSLLDLARLKKGGHDADQAFLLLNVVAGNRFSKRADFMINADHQIVDGIGIKILLNRFLTLLAVSLGSPQEETFDWDESARNLTPPWIELMNEDQLHSGPEYERVGVANQDFMYEKMPQNPGFALHSNPKTPNQKTHMITLNHRQSTQLLHATKHLISLDSTITHLGHAAMVLALLRSNPSTAQSQTLHSPCWLNGRRYLRPSSGHPNPNTSYLPICQSFAPVVFPNLGDLVSPKGASRGVTREKLIKACRTATIEYGGIRERKSMLPECVVLFEALGRNLYLRQQQEIRNKSNAPLSQSRDSPTRTADPFFLSDGITEQYIAHAYFDKAHSGPGQKKVFEVDEMHFAAHAEKNLIVRMSSWRDEISISGEWRQCDYDEVMIVEFLEDMVEIMLALVE